MTDAYYNLCWKSSLRISVLAILLPVCLLSRVFVKRICLTASKDINVLRSIVQVALRAYDNNSLDSNSFITIFKSYETVLRRKKIDTSKETFYFKLVVKLCRSPGTSWAEKFNNLLLVRLLSFDTLFSRAVSLISRIGNQLSSN